MVCYTLDPGASRFTVQAFAAGMLSAFAHSPTFQIREFTGELRLAPEALPFFSLIVKADSLALADAVSPNDRDEIEGRMQREVLETAVYPAVIFQSTQSVADKVADNWYRLRINGELQLHGVKKPYAVDAQVRILDDEVRLGGQCALSLAAFRIMPVTALGGMIKLKDEVKFQFEIAGRKRDA
jgi:polyisoprenoid-binding protein YceI